MAHFWLHASQACPISFLCMSSMPHVGPRTLCAHKSATSKSGGCRKVVQAIKKQRCLVMIAWWGHLATEAKKCCDLIVCRVCVYSTTSHGQSTTNPRPHNMGSTTSHDQSTTNPRPLREHVFMEIQSCSEIHGKSVVADCCFVVGCFLLLDQHLFGVFAFLVQMQHV